MCHRFWLSGLLALCVTAAVAAQPATIEELERAFQTAQSEVLPELAAIPFASNSNMGIYQFKPGATLVVQYGSSLVFKGADGLTMYGNASLLGFNEAKDLKDGKIPMDGYLLKACTSTEVFAIPTEVCAKLIPASDAVGIKSGTPHRIVGVSFDYTGSEDELIAKFESKWGKSWQSKTPVALAYNAGEKLARPIVIAGTTYTNAGVVLLTRKPGIGIHVVIADVRLNQVVIRAVNRIDAIVKKSVKDRADKPF